MEELRIATERREHALPIFCDVEPGTVDHNSLKPSYFYMKSDLPDTPEDTMQRWVDALTWVRGVSGITGWRHDSASKCAAFTAHTGHLTVSGGICGNIEIESSESYLVKPAQM